MLERFPAADSFNSRVLTLKPSSRPKQRFLKKFRLRSQLDFDRVFRLGLVASDSTLVVHATRNRSGFTRIGLSVSKRVGHAPCRNRWKRWIREAFRIHCVALPKDLDIVVRPRREAEGSFAAIEKSLQRLLCELDRRLPPSG